MTLTQAQMLAHFRLWMPQHACADFFETFYVFVKPVYAAIYFPGAALFYVPAAWLHLPSWVFPLIASGLLAAIVFRVFSLILDPAAGLLGVWHARISVDFSAALDLVSRCLIRSLTLLAMWAVWSWMNSGARNSRLGWATSSSAGAGMGWRFTWPVDAIAYGLPLGAAVMWDLRRQCMGVERKIAGGDRGGCVSWPFLALQLIQDKGITGHWLRAPIQLYDDQEMPGLAAYGTLMVGDAHHHAAAAKAILRRELHRPGATRLCQPDLGRRLEKPRDKPDAIHVAKFAFNAAGAVRPTGGPRSQGVRSGSCRSACFWADTCCIPRCSIIIASR